VEVSATETRFVTTEDATIGGAGTVSIPIQGVTTGALQAPSGTIDTIVTPIAGWDSVTNSLDITEGEDVESDLELRTRREESLQVTGAAVDLAIRSAIREIPGVDQALVISNRTSATVDGIPPHAFETVVHPDLGDPDFSETIAETIFRLQPAGIQAFGSSTFTVTDSEGFQQTVGFSFATEITMWVECNLTVDANFPANGSDQVAEVLLAEGNSLSVGDDVLIWKFVAALDSIPGIQTVDVRIEDTNPPTNTANIDIAFRDIAVFDSSRITVNV
jgi:uncharacterized phage protein gp47/JayE